jgi:hypothetical protein
MDEVPYLTTWFLRTFLRPYGPPALRASGPTGLRPSLPRYLRSVFPSVPAVREVVRNGLKVFVHSFGATGLWEVVRIVTGSEGREL